MSIISTYTIHLIILLIILALSSGCSRLISTVDSTPEEVISEPELKLPPRSALDHYIRGWNYENNAFYRGALIEYRRAVKYDPNSAELHYNIGRMFFMMEALDSAAAELQYSLSLDPDNSDALELFGQIRVLQNEWPAALEVYNILSSKYPEESTYHFLKAAVYLQLEQLDEAAVEYEKVMALTEENEEILSRIGNIYTAKEEYQKAVDYYLKVLKFDDTNDGIYYHIGTLYNRLEQYDSTAYYFRRALEINPRDVYYSGLAFIRFNHGGRDEAVDLMYEGIEKFPESARLHDLLGSFFYRRGDNSEALKMLHRAAELDTASVSPYITIGMIYHDLDSAGLAAEAYETALKIVPDDPLVLNNYAYLLAEKNLRLDNAYTMSAKSLESAPDNPSYLDTMGWILFRMGELDQAEVYIRRALEIDSNPEIYLHLGEILMAKGSESEAVQAFKKGLEQDPDNEKLKNKLGLN
ncbi:tetratricopeptide repeat protein [bacterium]|nr:tetratricopeptide repeat protein [FCB group bacterium]MBL7191112.1 tetratricopeptide repeat protein [bacterium]